MANYKYVLEAHKSDGTVDEVEIEVPQGDKGDPGVDVSSAAINDAGHLIITLSNGQQIDTGLAKGEDGKSSHIQLVPDGNNGYYVNVTNDGEKTQQAYISNGKTPSVYIRDIAGGHRVEFYVNESLVNSFEVMDGEDGKAPTVTVEPIAGGNRVTIGGESFDVMDGTGGGSGLTSLVDGDKGGSVKSIAAAAGEVGYNSVSLGSSTLATGENALAEGFFARASGKAAHAEGYATEASGTNSHAEGQQTKATYYNSHAEGMGTIASGEEQHVQGRFNVEDADSKYLHIVGNGGSDTARSNAHTLDKDGNAWFRGKVFVGGTGQDDPNAKELGTGGGSEMTDLETIALLAENGLLPTITDGSGRILTDAKNTIMLRY